MPNWFICFACRSVHTCESIAYAHICLAWKYYISVNVVWEWCENYTIFPKIFTLRALKLRHAHSRLRAWAEKVADTQGNMDLILALLAPWSANNKTIQNKIHTLFSGPDPTCSQVYLDPSFWRFWEYNIYIRVCTLFLSFGGLKIMI